MFSFIPPLRSKFNRAKQNQIRTPIAIARMDGQRVELFSYCSLGLSTRLVDALV